MGKAIDITGQKFGMLTAVRPLKERNKNGSVIWECLCDCGKITKVYTKDLRYKDGTRSCGCVKFEKMSRITAERNSSEKYKDIAKNNISNRHIDMGLREGTNASLLTQKVRTDSGTGVKGVRINRGKYFAEIVFQGKRHYLGRYNKLEDAILARNRAEEELFEPFLEWHTQNPISKISTK